MHAAPSRSSGPARRAMSAALATVAALAALLLGAAPAAAHATLTGSSPEDGEVVATAPAEVVLTFSEEVALSEDSLRVLDPEGERSDTGEPVDRSADGRVAYAVPLLDGLADGTYTVAWQVVSADSHPVSGAFTFSIGAPSTTTVVLAEQSAGSGLVGLLYGIGRYGAYAGFLLMVGSAVYVLACRPDASRDRAIGRLTVTGWSLLAGATVALLLLRYPYTSTGRLADALSMNGLRQVVETSTGTALVSRLLLLAAAGLFIAVLYGGYARAHDAERRRDLAFGLTAGGGVLAAGLAATWALAEHASTGRQTAVAIPADMVHMLAAAVWLGGLAAVLLQLHRTPAALTAGAVRRYSSLALSSVLFLILTGLYQSWRQVGSWTALTTTSYGQLLMVKTGLVLLLASVGWISRRWTARLSDPAPGEPPEAGREPRADPEPEPPSPGGPGPVDPARAAQLARQRAAIARQRRLRSRAADPDRAGLRRSVLTEAAIAALVLLATTALTGSVPARTALTVDAPSDAPAAVDGTLTLTLAFDTGGQDGAGSALLDLSPGRTGENDLHIRTVGPDGEPLPAEEVRFALTLPAEDLGPLRFTPERVDLGHWSAAGVRLPRPGEWELALTIRTSDIDQVTEKTTLSIG